MQGRTSALLLWAILLIMVTALMEARKPKKSKPNSEEMHEGEWATGNSTPIQILGFSSVKIASFNMKQFGPKKSKNEQILKIISKIVMRYDLIALQEITDAKENSIKRLMETINFESSFPYQYVISPRVGRSKQKEQYALIYRPEIFQVKRKIVFDDSVIGDSFSREPQIVEVILKENGKKIVFINMHVAPRDAVSEINSLTDVHTWVKDKWRIPDIVILGDLNADCDYIRKKDVPNIRLLNNPTKYVWLIPNTFDTTVGNTKCAYDRIIISGPYLKRNLVPQSPGVLEFDTVFKLDQNQALNVSDHYPVEFTIYVEQNIQEMAEEHLPFPSGGNSLNILQLGIIIVVCDIISGFKINF